MNFEAVVNGEVYRFSVLKPNTVFVSSPEGEYILYRDQSWKCADDISHKTIAQLGEVIDQQLSLETRRSAFSTKSPEPVAQRH